MEINKIKRKYRGVSKTFIQITGFFNYEWNEVPTGEEIKSKLGIIELNETDLKKLEEVRKEENK